MTQRDDIQRAFQMFWSVIDGSGFDAPFILEPGEHVGEMFRAWSALEEYWVKPVSIKDVLEAVPLDSFETESPPARRLLAWSHMLTLIGDEMHAGDISEVLKAFVLRQGVFSVDPRPVLSGPIPPPRVAFEPAGDTDYDLYDIQDALTNLAAASRIMEGCLGGEAAAEDALALDSGTIQQIKLLPPRPFGRIYDTVDTTWASDPRGSEIVSRVRSNRLTSLDLLSRAARLHAGNADILHALGTWLGLKGELERAAEWLRKADELQPRDISTRYMLSDVAAAAGSRPVASMGDFIDLSQLDPAGDYEPWADLDGGDVYLTIRGVLVELGQAEPFSRSPKEQPNVEFSSPTKAAGTTPITQADLDEQTKQHQKDLQAHEDRMMVANAAVRNEVRDALAREAFFLDQLAQLMPRTRRQRAENFLKLSISSWSNLPRSARDRLVGALLTMSDAELTSGESSTAIFASMAACVEVVGRYALALRDGSRLVHFFEPAERRGASEHCMQSLQQLRDRRIPAIHASGDVTRADIAAMWQRVVGAKGEPGLVDELMALR